MVMDSLVATHDGKLNGYTALTIAGTDERYFIPAAGSTVARFPTPGYVERINFACESAAGVDTSRGRIRLGTTAPQTLPATFKASYEAYLNGVEAGGWSPDCAPMVGIPVPKDEVLSIDADNGDQAVANAVVLFIRRGAAGIAPLKTYERVTRQNATYVAAACAANTWTPVGPLAFEGVLEQNKLYHLLGAALVEQGQQQTIVAGRFRQVETAIGGTLDPRPTCLGANYGPQSRFIRFPEVIAFPGSAPPAFELVDDGNIQAPKTVQVELLLGEVGVLSPGQMQQQMQRAQQQHGVPWQ